MKFAPVIEGLAHVATVVAAFIAGLALGYAKMQVDDARTTQREATAYSAYNDYLKLAVEYPHLACVDTPTALAELSNHWTDDRHLVSERQRYDSFVATMLSASEQVLDARPDDPEWEAAITSNLACHAPLLSAGGYESSYSCGLRALIARETGNSSLACGAQ